METLSFDEYMEKIKQERTEETPVNVDPSAAAPGQINVTVTNQANGKLEKFRVAGTLTLDAFKDVLVQQGWGLKSTSGIAGTTPLSKVAQEGVVEFDALNNVLAYKPVKDTIKTLAPAPKAPVAAPAGAPVAPASGAPAQGQKPAF